MADEPKKPQTRTGTGAGARKSSGSDKAPSARKAAAKPSSAAATAGRGAKNSTPASGKPATPRKPAAKAATGAPSPKRRSGASASAKTTSQKTDKARRRTETSAGGSKAQTADTGRDPRETDAKGDAGSLGERWIAAASKVFESAAISADRVAKTGIKRSMFDPYGAVPALSEFAFAAIKSPRAAIEAQMTFAADITEIWKRGFSRLVSGEPTEPVAAPDRGDKRFRDPRWNENAGLDLIKQSYLAARKSLLEAVAKTDGLDAHQRNQALFFAAQLADAASPTNFAFTNPDVIDETIRTKGENIIRGFERFADDLSRGGGAVSISQTDMDAFKVGENVATTPGQVVFRNDLFELIQYAPTTPEADKRPLLIFPPWINKFYILDLRPENSFVKWATDQGITVYLVSWVNPGPELKDKSFEDYMFEGVYAALDAVEQSCGEREVDAIGYCIGGTLLSTTLAHMAAKGDDRVKSATFFAAQADFKEAGELKVFIDDNQIANIAERMDDQGGVLDSGVMASVFNMLRANDLIWSFVVSNYLLGRDPKRFDLLFWNADATRLTKAEHLFYLKRFYLDNDLAEGRMTLGGERLDLGAVRTPVFFQASRSDHIAPYPSVYRGVKLFGGPKRFMLAGSGHIAGVINPPAAEKYQHWTREDIVEDVEDWIAGATEVPGSWWPAWIEWLRALPGREGRVPARDPAKGGLKPLEPAPGSYVKVMSV